MIDICHQIPTDYKENVDAKKTIFKAGKTEVISEHRNHGNAAHYLNGFAVNHRGNFS